MGIKREPIDETEQNDLKKEVADKFKLERNIKVEPPDSGDENAGGGDGDFDKEEERALEPHKNTNTQYKKTDDC